MDEERDKTAEEQLLVDAKPEPPSGDEPEAKDEIDSPNESLAAGLAKASQLGVAMLANLLVGFVIGTALDRFFGTSPWLLFIFLLLGVVAGFVSMFKIAMGKYR
jgi:F0F1-type ATP synthase assembly protein I